MMIVASLLLTLFSVLPQSAAQVQTRPQHAAMPGEVAAPVAALIAPGGMHVEVGKAGLDFWLVKSIPLKAASPSSISWSAVEEGTLVGVVRISADYPDIRGKNIKPGVYTLRYGIQPSNGDHLGVSPFRDFLLLSPAARDGDPAPRGHDRTIEISKETIGGSHPAVLSIDPPSAGPKDQLLGTHTTELGHQAVIVEIPVSGPDGAAGALRFGIVVVGRIEA